MKKIYLSFLLLPHLLQAQMTNFGNLQIHSGGSVAVTGDFTNASTAVLLNNQALYLRGQLTNNQASMSAGTGTLYLNGSSAQIVDGSASYMAYNLETSNAAGITINRSLYINGFHNFVSGNLVTGTSAFVVYAAGSSYSGAADSRHVYGWVKKLGSTDFTFPVGNATYLREVALLNLSASSEYDVSYAGATYQPTNVHSPLVSMNGGEHWQVNKISGGSAQVQLNWNTAKVGFPAYPLAAVRAAVYTSAWTDVGGNATGNVYTSGTVASNALTTIGRVGIGSGSYAVPLKFLTLTASRESEDVRVRWQTAEELNVSDYEIQRSSDGRNFETVGHAAALNGATQSYVHLDRNVPSSRLYYRIRSIDLDGSIAYSIVVSVAAVSENEGLSLAGNPVRGAIRLASTGGLSGSFNYLLINAAGQVCQSGNFSVSPGGIASIPLKILSKGAYTLVTSVDKSTQRFKVLVD